MSDVIGFACVQLSINKIEHISTLLLLPFFSSFLFVLSATSSAPCEMNAVQIQWNRNRRSQHKRPLAELLNKFDLFIRVTVLRLYSFWHLFELFSVFRSHCVLISVVGSRSNTQNTEIGFLY